jgi:nitrogen fixation-related uncharacterized protein
VTWVHGLIWGSWVIFGIVVVWAFAWALQNDQFRGLTQQSQMIFDDQEPIGDMTDTFPGMAPDEVQDDNTSENGGV